VGYTIRFDDCSDPHATRIKVPPPPRMLEVWAPVPGLTCAPCASVPDGRHAGAGDDGRPPSEEIQVRASKVGCFLVLSCGGGEKRSDVTDDDAGGAARGGGGFRAAGGLPTLH